ncbi:MAG: chorismate-binding protein [Clostridiales bacterium]|nr:chorismate-binding protein [Clostridiales bacterium]
MISPTLEEARRIAPGHALIPISMELYADLRTPVEVLKSILACGQEACMLESAPGGENWGRYTFIGCSPDMELRAKGNRVSVIRGASVETVECKPVEYLRKVLKECASPKIATLPPFAGGFVGYFAYEMFGHSEPTLKLAESDDVGFDDFRLLRFGKVIAFDNLRQKMILITNISTGDLEQNYMEGVADLKDLEYAAMAQFKEAARKPSVPVSFKASATKEEFMEKVEKAKKHIFEGDIFQVVPSLRFSSPFGDSLLPAYRALRTINPSSYMFYLKFTDLQLAGASPETLVSLKDGIASTYPLAGTCKRPESADEEAKAIEELLHDEKELAEHQMLVDLGRNDLGKVCKFGTVTVPEHLKIKKLSHVCHIASRVTGEAKEGVEALDVVLAALPAGTLSGAPKKRAAEIITELEGFRRGVYGGAVGYIDFAGSMDLCIGIRMAVLKDGVVHVQAGAGIVYDSVPEKEYEECASKAKAMIEALKVAEGAGK